MFRLVINVRKMGKREMACWSSVGEYCGMSWQLINKIGLMWTGGDGDVGEWNGYWQRIEEQVHCKQ
jgi:hypothetical protein